MGNKKPIKILEGILIMAVMWMSVGILETYIGISFEKKEWLWKVLYRLSMCITGMITLDIVRSWGKKEK